MSIKRALRACGRMPSAPSHTCSTSLGWPTMVMTTSDAAASSPGVSHHVAPRASSAAAFSGERL